MIFFHFGYSGVPGHYGVVAFFVLSGFLITWLMLREQEKTGTVSLRAFYQRRALRIFPAFYAFWFFWVGVLITTGRDVPWTHALSAFTYWSNYYNGIVGDPNNGFSHTWSLAIEEQFYLLWPLLFLLLRRNPSALAWRIGAIVVGIWAYRLVLVFGLDVREGYIYSAFETRADALLCGCLLAVVLYQRRLQRFWVLLTSSQWAAVATTALVIFFIYWSPIARARDVIGFTLVPPLMALVVAQIVSLHRTPLWSWTEWAWVRYLGRISYPLYLYQQVTLYPARTRVPGPEIVGLAAGIAITVVLASLSYYLVEMPFLRLKTRYKKVAG